MISATAGKVEGMDVRLTLELENQEGSLKLKLEGCGSHVKDISIKLDGGASWLYQGYGNNHVRFLLIKDPWFHISCIFCCFIECIGSCLSFLLLCIGASVFFPNFTF